MPFEGFPRDVTRFFEGLRANNNKEWFSAHADDYERAVRIPALALISDLSVPLMDFDPPLKAEPKVNGSLRRINRDVRFSADKSPYQTHLHLIFWAGDHPNMSPGVHIIIGANGLGYGCGQWAFEPEGLARLRRAFELDDGAAFRSALASAEGVGARLDPPELRRVPAGFDPQSPVADLLKHKGFVVRTGDIAVPEALHDARGVDFVLDICRALNPVNRFLMENLRPGD
ncbi:MAG: DUF2461 domain-containing protein [Hyphomicrobiaceae bacterium]|nr:DUF2461 domain-containing protein [Hyphomicrobiaceae bacterium]